MDTDRLIHKFRLQLLAWLHRSRPGPIYLVKRLPYSDVKKATDGFHRIIYSHSQGAAYKANFEDGGVQLVKEVRVFDEGDDLFYREVQLLGRLHHRHLLKLGGFCVGRKRLLVFDNIENGSLKEHLNDPLKTPLNWRTRLQIAVGVAAALEYLFVFSDPPVYHVSISSGNIMLDENFTAKLSDVGLLSSSWNHHLSAEALISKDHKRRHCGNIMFQLGLLILELITGQSSDERGSDLVQWIQESHFDSSMHKMIDPDLGNGFNFKELTKLLSLAKLCINSGDKPRFSVPQVLRYLQNKVQISC